MQEQRTSLRKRLTVGTKFHVPPWILDDTEVTEHDCGLDDVPRHIAVTLSTDAWTFRAQETSQEYADDETKWLGVVSPHRTRNHEAVVYLCWCDDDGTPTGGHHEVYASGIVTDD